MINTGAVSKESPGIYKNQLVSFMNTPVWNGKTLS